MLVWIEQEVAKTGMSQLFLESSVQNKKGRNFFTDLGFQTVSKVMAKKLW
jgi:hypothetical protein